jgi:hypothetical protein
MMSDDESQRQLTATQELHSSPGRMVSRHREREYRQRDRE